MSAISFFPNKILLATDGSTEILLAAKTAAELAGSTGSELHVVLVYSCARPSALDPVSLDKTVRDAVEGSRGLGAMRRALMGSVSLSTVRHAHCSVLVVRDSADREVEGDGPGRVLLAYDGSKGSSAAAEAAAEIADFTGSELHLLFVAASEPYPPPFDYVSNEEPGFWEA